MSYDNFIKAYFLYDKKKKLKNVVDDYMRSICKLLGIGHLLCEKTLSYQVSINNTNCENDTCLGIWRIASFLTLYPVSFI